MRVSMLAVTLLVLAAACGSDGTDGPVVVGGATAVSAGIDGTCAIGTSGGLACWGSVPTGTPEDTSAGAPDALGAVPISTPIDLISVSLSRGIGSNSGCVVGTDNQAYCWGYLSASDQGQLLGDGIEALPGFTGMSSISVGQYVLCGTRTDRGVRCVGWYTGGGRGTDSIADPNAFDLTPNVLKPATTAFGTAIGGQFGCAVRTDSLVACWGDRHGGRLGGAAGDTLQNCGDEGAAWCQPGPAPIAGGVKYRQVAANQISACAVRISGGVDCWGRKMGVEVTGFTGLQCNPTDACLYTPTAITLPGAATRVGVGGNHACALLTTGDVYCWGDNSVGELGRPGDSSPTPVLVSGGFTFVTLSVGSGHTCAIEAGSGAIGCWGDNTWGQLGDGTQVNRDHPVAVVAGE